MNEIYYITPEELKALTKKGKKATDILLKYLKKRRPGNLDDIVHRLHREAFDKFSCLDCANCCKAPGPRLIDKDIERLARLFRMKPSDFFEKYVITDEDGDSVFREHPCPFLMSGNLCMVYEDRPKACREYPHTDRRRFIQILDLSRKNCETCPVVYNIFEELKTMQEFRI